MEKLLDNSVRGNRAVFWMKVMLVMAVVLFGVLMAMGYVMGGLPKNLNEATASQASTVLYLLLGFFVACGLFLLSLAIQGCYWVAWMYRSVTNLRILGSTKISPLLAVILSIIPYLGMIAHFFVFREMVTKMEAKLKELNVEHPQVSMSQLSAFCLLIIMSVVGPLVNDGQITMVISGVAGAVAMICYIIALSVYVKQEKLLLTAGQEEIFRRKVDEEIKKREAGIS